MPNVVPFATDPEFFNISNYHDFINSNMNNVGVGFDFLEKDNDSKVVFTNNKLIDKKTR